MAKTAAQAGAKWDSGTQAGAKTWADNIQSTQKPIVARAVAQRQVMVTNFNASTQPGGLWERKLTAVGDAGIKAAAALSQGMYTAGTLKSQPKFLAAITKIIAFEQAGLPAIEQMASGNTEAGVARASAWIRYMASGKGQLGA